MSRETEIVETAQGLFAQFGLKKVTTDDIARAGSVSKATIYRYYKNKAEIFDEVVRTETDQLVFAIRQAVDKESTVRGKFHAHLMTRLSRIQDFINFYRVTQDTWGDYWPHIAHVRQRFLDEEEKIVREILHFGNKGAELEVKKVDLVAHILVVALTSVEYHWALDGQSVTLSRYVDLMLDMMIDGIRKR